MSTYREINSSSISAMSNSSHNFQFKVNVPVFHVGVSVEENLGKKINNNHKMITFLLLQINIWNLIFLCAQQYISLEPVHLLTPLPRSHTAHLGFFGGLCSWIPLPATKKKSWEEREREREREREKDEVLQEIRGVHAGKGGGTAWCWVEEAEEDTQEMPKRIPISARNGAEPNW